MIIRLSNEEKRAIEKVESSYMIGILATGDESFFKQRSDWAPICPQRNSTYENVDFYIKPVSQEPEILEDLINNNSMMGSYYIGQSNSINLKGLGINSFEYNPLDIDSKVEKIKEKFKDKIIVFKPKIKMNLVQNSDSLETKEYKLYKNLEIQFVYDKEDGMSIDSDFERVPELSYRRASFEEKLESGEYITFREEGYDKYWPQFIICGSYIYSDFDTWENDPTNTKNKKLIKGDSKFKWKRHKLNRKDKNHIQVTNNTWFIKYDSLMEYPDEENLEEVNSIELEYEEELKETLNNDVSEFKFLNAFKNYTKNQGLSYGFEDLANFHLCLKTNVLTILAGMTGTGKSKLARIYSEMLDLSSSNGTLLFLPISPSYNEPSDILGYLNPSTGVYIPSETGLVDILVKAQDTPGKMFVVVFDEMNLSQVEHWFAPFISILEEKEENRYLTLYSDNIKCLNDFIYPSKVKLGNNLRFIGTMNMDETTKDISDRLLDRSNVITLVKNSFLELKEILEENENINQIEGSYQSDICKNLDTYNSWIKKDNPYKNFTGSDLEFFDELHNLIISYDSQKGVSFRVLEQIGIYLNNIPYNLDDNLTIEFSKALDLQIKQRIISKLKGTKKQFGEIIGEYNFEDKVVENSELLKLLERNDIQSISSFKGTIDELIRKSKELTLYGYTN